MRLNHQRRAIAVILLLSFTLTACGDPERELLNKLYTVENGLEKTMKLKRVLKAEHVIDAATDTKISRAIADISTKVTLFKNNYLAADLLNDSTFEGLLQNIQEIFTLIQRLADDAVLGIKNPDSQAAFKAATTSMSAAALAAVVAIHQVRKALQKKEVK